MKNPIVRGVVGLLAGIFVANLLIVLVESSSRLFYELPPELQADAATMADPVAREAFMQAWAAYMPTAPLGMMLFPLAAWFLGSGVGAAVAARLAPGSGMRQALFVGGLILLGTFYNLSNIPHPSWMWLAGPAGVVLGTWLGLRLGGALAASRPET